MAKQAKIIHKYRTPHRASKGPICPECGRRQRLDRGNRRSYKIELNNRERKPSRRGYPCQFDDAKAGSPFPIHLTDEVRASQAKDRLAVLAATAKVQADRTARRTAQHLTRESMAADAAAAYNAHDEAILEDSGFNQAKAELDALS
jgi:hypothetical protein